MRSARGWTRYPRRTFYAFISPWLLGFILLTVFPMLYGLGLSFTNFDGVSPRWKWVGLSNYAELFHDADAWVSILRTLGFVALVVPLSVGGSLGLALIINRRLKAVGLWRAIFFLPSVVPVVAMAIMWKLVFNKDAGIVNATLRALGLHGISWMTDPTVFWVLVILMLWGVGGGMIVMLGALQGVPPELEEAAIVDGAGRFRVFWNVTLPMISPILFFQTITSVIGSLQVLIQPLLLTNAAGMAGVGAVPDSNRLYMVEVYQQIFLNSRFGYGSAMLWVFFLVILGITLLILRSSRGLVYYEVDIDAPSEGGR